MSHERMVATGAGDPGRQPEWQGEGRTVQLLAEAGLAPGATVEQVHLDGDFSALNCT